MASKKEGDFNLRILVCGKTGVGKSSLINSIFGCEVCRVVDPGSEDGSLDPCTTQLQTTEVNINGITVIIYDSPGLQDGTDNEERYLQEMYDTCEDVDIVIYCMDMTITRYAVPEIQSAQLLTERFGTKFWERCVIVMTKANCVWVPRDREPLVYHKNLYKNLSQVFHSHLVKQGVSSSVANSIPAVAAGRCDCHAVDESISQAERYVWYVSDQSDAKEPTDFLSELWVTLFQAAGRCSADSRRKFVAATAQDDRIEALDKGSASTLQELLQNEIKQLRESNSDYAVKMVAGGHNYRPVLVKLDNRQIHRMRPGFISRWTNEMVMRWGILGSGVLGSGVLGSRRRWEVLGSRWRWEVLGSIKIWGVLIAIVVGTIGVGLWLWLGYPDNIWDICWYRHLSISYVVGPVLSFLGSLFKGTTITTSPTIATNPTTATSDTIVTCRTIATFRIIAFVVTTATCPTIATSPTIATTATSPTSPTTATSPTIATTATIATSPTSPTTATSPTIATTATSPTTATTATSPTIATSPIIATSPTTATNATSVSSQT